MLGIPSAASLYGFLLRRAGVGRVATVATVAALLFLMSLALPVASEFGVLITIASGTTSYLVLTIRNDARLVFGVFASLAIGFGIATALDTVGLGVFIVFVQVIGAALAVLGRPSPAVPPDPDRGGRLSDRSRQRA